MAMFSQLSVALWKTMTFHSEQLRSVPRVNIAYEQLHVFGE